MKGKRDEASQKFVNIALKQIMLQFKTDRQISYQPNADAGFRNQSETPLWVGFALMFHEKKQEVSV